MKSLSLTGMDPVVVERIMGNAISYKWTGTSLIVSFNSMGVAERAQQELTAYQKVLDRAHAKNIKTFLKWIVGRGE